MTESEWIRRLVAAQYDRSSRRFHDPWPVCVPIGSRGHEEPVRSPDRRWGQDADTSRTTRSTRSKLAIILFFAGLTLGVVSIFWPHRDETAWLIAFLGISAALASSTIQMDGQL